MLEKRVADALGLQYNQVKGALALLNDGNTVPFIARYRKEMTGNLDEVQIRDVSRIAGEITQLEERRATILATIKEQGVLTKELESEIKKAENLSRLEDLYAPYRPRRLTRGKKALEAGLEPLARWIESGKDPQSRALEFLHEDYSTEEEVIKGAMDILAEEMADKASLRDYLRSEARTSGFFVSKRRRGAEGDKKYEMYLDFQCPVKSAKPHQILAIRRGEQEKELSAGLLVDEERVLSRIARETIDVTGPGVRFFRMALEEGFQRLLHPAIERDIRRELEDQADEHAISVFALNLKNLLLQPPMPGKVVLGIDPGLRTGCKYVVVNEMGSLVTTGHFYIHDNRKRDAPAIIRAVVDQKQVALVAIGNGTGSRETEEVVAEALKESSIAKYTLVNEAGASVYSASDIARREFPDLDVSIRGAVSIARRLQDPLAELVKIDPKSIGVGMYQHDVNQVALQDSLGAVVEDVVNSVGVDLNSASEALLAQVAGIGPTLARRIIDHRDQNGPFKTREELLNVRGLGARTYEQCAGFLRIREGAEPLDRTGIHPENYDLARAILEEVNDELGSPSLQRGLENSQKAGRLQKLAAQFGVGELTLGDILDGLIRPGRDPREELDPPQLRSDVLNMDDLQEGMRLEGTVRNVVDFGAFVDIGVKEDGLVHISEMADRFVKNPYDLVSVGDRVKVIILSVDRKRGRIGLSMKGLS